MKPTSPKPGGEEGFVLISAIWLLLLGAAVVAVIQLMVLDRAKSTAFDKAQLKHRLALETAYETAVADMLFNGPRSAFAKLPAETSYTLNGKAITVRMSAESGRLDVNKADLTLIDQALMGLGVNNPERTAFLGVLTSARNKVAGIATTDDLDAALRETGLDSNYGFCMAQYLTVHSGLPRPLAGQMPTELARAIGEPDLSTNAGVQPGSALRIAIAALGGPPLVVVVRITARLDQAADVLDWSAAATCTTSSLSAGKRRA